MTNEQRKNEGWARPINSRKHHYFRKGQSVCGKWAFFGGNLEPDTFNSPDDCVACRRVLNMDLEKGLYDD